MSLYLSRFHLGRMLLHALCAVRRGHWKWHLAGIQREIMNEGPKRP